jgi:uncharacterized membrane protein YphA (DoxX/SURF4 family)
MINQRTARIQPLLLRVSLGLLFLAHVALKLFIKCQKMDPTEKSIRA